LSPLSHRAAIQLKKSQAWGAGFDNAFWRQGDNEAGGMIFAHFPDFLDNRI
jgi:hypothetical protein